jgi:Nuclear condensing complex subunits, C-term domain
MDETQILKGFYETLPKKYRDQEIFITKVTEAFSQDPEPLEIAILYILQQSFKKKRAKLIKSSEINNIEVYRLLCKVLKSAIYKSIQTTDRKVILVKKITDYATECSRSKDKLIRGWIVQFLLVLKSYKIKEFEAESATIKEIVNLIIKDKDQKNRKFGLTLAKEFSMRSLIHSIITQDPAPLNRKTAIKMLDQEDSILFDIAEGLKDKNQLVRMQTLAYCIKYEVMLKSDALKVLFLAIYFDKFEDVKKKGQELLQKLIARSSYKILCDVIELSGAQRAQIEYHQAILSGFFDILKNKKQDAYDIIHEYLPRLLIEKENIDISSLFMLRISFSVLKSLEISLRDIVEKYELQSHIPRLLEYFYTNKENYYPDYYFKLQNILLISFIDVDEECRETLLKSYFNICKEVPLEKFHVEHWNNKIDYEVTKDYNYEGVCGTNHFAKDEEDIISSIILIIREIYKNSEHQYILRLKQEVIDDVIAEVAAGENETGLYIPLKAKYEKNEMKLKLNEINLSVYNQNNYSNFIDLAEIDEFDSKKLHIENKLKIILEDIKKKSYRGLLITAHVLKNASFLPSMNPELLSLAQNFISHYLKHENFYISELALICLGYSCLLSKDQAEQYLSLFLDNLKASSQSIRLVSLNFIFDILMVNQISIELNQKCVKELKISLNEYKKNIQLIAVEGFCKLLLRKIVCCRVVVIEKLFQIYFEAEQSSEVYTIIKAFCENYSKISLEMSLELARGYLIYIFINKKTESQIKLANSKLDSKVTEIVHLFNPEIQNFPEKTENIQLLIFLFSYKYFKSNQKFFFKILENLNFKGFGTSCSKFVKNRLNELQTENKNYHKDLERFIKALPCLSEVVEDISNREYFLKIEEIEIESAQILKEARCPMIDC